MINRHLTGWEKHILVLRGLKPLTVQSYRRKIEKFYSWLKKTVKDSKPPIATRKNVEAYLEYCYYKGNSQNTRFTKLIAIQSFARFLVYEEIIEKDFTSGIPRPQIPTKAVQKFTKEEVLKIFKSIDIETERGLRDCVIFILALFAGLRLGEIQKLTLNDIIYSGDNAVDVNIIESKKCHGGRNIYLWKVPSEYVKQWLAYRFDQEAKGGDPLLVSYSRGGTLKGGKMNASTVDSILKQYAKKAGIRRAKITMHMYRATHACDLRHIRGYDIAAIAARLGHINISTTDRYIPARERIRKISPSLAVYWKDFSSIWMPSVNQGSVVKDQGTAKQFNI